MIIGKFVDSNYTSYVSSAGGCGRTSGGKNYWIEGGYRSGAFDNDPQCTKAKLDWNKKYGNLNITKHPDSTASGGGLSPRSTTRYTGCTKPSGSKYWRYTANYAGKPITGYGATCDAAKQDWNNLVRSRSNYVAGATKPNGGFAANSQKIAKAGGHPTATVSGSSGANTLKNSGVTGAGGSGIAGLGAGVGRVGSGIGASINASVSGLNQAVSNVLPDSIEDKLPEGMPLWILPVGIVGAGLLLILLVRKR